MKKLITFTTLALVLSSCSSAMRHKFMRGTVAMKVDNKTAHVCLGENEVKKGDKISFYYQSCDRPDPEDPGLKGLCTLEQIGTGKITRTFNNHYSEVTTDGSFKFSKGTLIQKM
ncbi:MAG: hypothetical protein CME70_23485 [Halobacteriovorax sp.]|nr:hypothetical protein [Halobacteriovorax sp.]|tara:strand:- start:142647 stop:142988 length:342 start_codon:yes stop_codon:yes gene_type:complete